MRLNPYESPRPLPEASLDGPLQDRPWSLALTGLFAGGYIGAWVGSLSGAGVGLLLALAASGGVMGYASPGFSLAESLITTGLITAIVGTLFGGGLGALLGLVLGSVASVSGAGMRKAFIMLSCATACVAALSASAIAFQFDVSSQEWRPWSDGGLEAFARVAALGVVGFGAWFGGGLLGRILREVAWECGPRVEVVENPRPHRIEETSKASPTMPPP
jgi:hypothetical protein